MEPIDTDLSSSGSAIRSSRAARADTNRETFDVFLAHNSAEKPAVERIAAELRSRGLTPWLDKEQIRPGQWFQSVIQAAIQRVRSAAIVLGEHGVGRWQALELRAFVSQCVENQVPVIPVLLPGVTKLPDDLVFLRELNYVQFESLSDGPAYDLLVWGVTGVRPNSRGVTHVPGVATACLPGNRLVDPALVDELEDLLIQRERRRLDDVRRLAYGDKIDKLVQTIASSLSVAPGKIVAGAELIRPVGRGNFGAIWVGKATEDGRKLAVKVFHLHNLTEGVMLWRFRRSIRAMRRLANIESPHPNIVRILDETDDGLAFSMEFFAMGNLEEISSRRWTLAKKLEVFGYICDAVLHAHSIGIVHRDIKPANVLLDDQERPVLTDFDIADIRFVTRLSVAKGGLGTPVFAAPEQLADGESADFRSDVYSLGRLLHYFLLEKSPGHHTERDPSFSDLKTTPTTLIRAIRRATAWTPADRYPSVDRLAAAVAAYQSPTARLVAAGANAGRWVRRNQWVLLFMLVASIVAVGAIKYRQYKEGESTRRDLESSRKFEDLNDRYNQQVRSLTAQMNQLLVTISALQTQQQQLIDERANWTEIARNKEKQASLRLKLRDVKEQLEAGGRPTSGTGAGTVSPAPLPIGAPTAAFMKSEFERARTTPAYINANEPGGEQELDDDTIKSVIELNLTSIGTCAISDRTPGSGVKRINLEFVIRNSGVISALKVDDHWSGRLWQCIWAKMNALRFPRFKSAEQEAHYWFTVND